MDKLIEEPRQTAEWLKHCGIEKTAEEVGRAARRLEECRALLQRLANDEPAPEGHTFQSWARELLA